MIENLMNLKDEYLLNGGEDVEFLNKVNQLESHLKFKKPLKPALVQNRPPANDPFYFSQLQPKKINHRELRQPT